MPAISLKKVTANTGQMDPLVKSRNGTKGVLEVRNSKNTKQAKKTTLKESRIGMTGWFHGISLPPMLRARTKVIMNDESITAPGRSKDALSEGLRCPFPKRPNSNFCVGSDGSRTVEITAMAPAIATGNSAKNVLVSVRLNKLSAQVLTISSRSDRQEDHLASHQ